MKRIILTLFLCSSAVGFSQTLNDYLKIAFENNPGLQAQYKEFEAALQVIPQVSTLPDPSAAVSYFIPPMGQTDGEQLARFSLSQMFPWFGTLRAQGDAAALMAEAKYQAFLDARNRLFYQVAAAYFPLFELNRFIGIEQDNSELLRSFTTIAKAKFQNGIGSMVDVLRVDIMLKESVTNLKIFREKERPLKTVFNKVLNRSETEPISVVDTIVTEQLTEGWRKDSLLAQNPVLKELDYKVQSFQASEEAAVKRGLPQFGVGLDYVLMGPIPGANISGNGMDVLMPTLSFSIPIYREKYTSAIREAQLMQESYSKQKQEYANILISSYHTAWFEVQQQLNLIQLYDQQASEAQQALNLLFTSYSTSGDDFEEVLRMQQQLLTYKKMKASSEAAYQVAVAQINYLTAKAY